MHQNMQAHQDTTSEPAWQQPIDKFLIAVFGIAGVGVLLYSIMTEDVVNRWILWFGGAALLVTCSIFAWFMKKKQA